MRRILILTAMLFAAAVGCAAIERAARDVEYVAGGEATTQPSAAVEGARVVAQVATAASPAVAQIASIVALLSGTVAGIAGHLNGKRSQRKTAHSVITEIVEDIKAFQQPDVPWTDATRELLEDLGYAEIARN